MDDVTTGQGFEIGTVKQSLLQGQKAVNEVISFLENLQVRIDLPGLANTNINVTFDDGVLVISQGKPAIEEMKFEKHGIVAVNRVTQMTVSLCEKLSESDLPVVICGEIGTGKQLFARTIHKLGKWQTMPFTWVTCSSEGDPETLADILENVESGTLFFDGVDELSEQCWELLRSRQENSDLNRHFRTIVSLRHNPEEFFQQASQKNTRLDHLQGCVLTLPSLKDRPEDIVPLVDFHVKRLCEKKSMPKKELSPEFIQMLLIYHWPPGADQYSGTGPDGRRKQENTFFQAPSESYPHRRSQKISSKKNRTLNARTSFLPHRNVLERQECSR